MSKLNAIKENPDLEEHFMIYVGLRHLHRYYKNHFDPHSEYDIYTQELYYEALRDGAYEDLQRALANEIDLYPRDHDFEAVFQAAVEDVIQRKGMEAIIDIAKEFVRIMEGREDDEHYDPYSPDPELSCCPNCDSFRIPLTLEDLPQTILETYPVNKMRNGAFWLCLKCHQVSNATVRDFKGKKQK